MLKNTVETYGWVSICIHWLMALGIFAMFALGVWMVTLDYYDAWYHRAPELHKSIGMLLLILLLFRFGWRLTNKRPELMGRAWEKIVALATHRVHYLLMFAITLSGYFIPTAEGKGIEIFNWFAIPALFSFEKQQVNFIGQLHLISAWALIGLAAIHAAASLKHHIVDGDATLARMLGIPPNTNTTHKEKTS